MNKIQARAGRPIESQKGIICVVKGTMEELLEAIFSRFRPGE
jgi:hypothetical protein